MGQKREREDLLCIDALKQIQKKVDGASPEVVKEIESELCSNPDIRYVCLNSKDREKHLSSSMLEAQYRGFEITLGLDSDSYDSQECFDKAKICLVLGALTRDVSQLLFACIHLLKEYDLHIGKVSGEEAGELNSPNQDDF